MRNRFGPAPRVPPPALCLLACAVAVSSSGLAAPTADEERPIAVLPVENLSGAPAPLAEIHRALRNALEARGVALIAEDRLAAFMARRRMRHVGGVSRELARTFRNDLGAGAVLVTALDLWETADPPKLGLIVRLVSTGDRAAIAWMDAVHLAGHQRPGMLDLGLVHEADTLLARAVGRLTDSLSARDRRAARAFRDVHSYRPRKFFGAPFAVPRDRRPLAVAVLPFSNESGHPRAGEIAALHFVLSLRGNDDLLVLEPGTVRQALLRGRVVRQGGVSLPQADLLRALLNVDLVLSGNVSQFREHRGPWGVPEVSFTVRAIDTRRRQSVWTSVSYNRGDDRVVLFDLGRTHTASRLALGMARGVARVADRQSRRTRR